MGGKSDGEFHIVFVESGQKFSDVLTRAQRAQLGKIARIDKTDFDCYWILAIDNRSKIHGYLKYLPQKDFIYVKYIYARPRSIKAFDSKFGARLSRELILHALKKHEVSEIAYMPYSRSGKMLIERWLQDGEIMRAKNRTIKVTYHVPKPGWVSEIPVNAVKLLNNTQLVLPAKEPKKTSFWRKFIFRKP